MTEEPKPHALTDAEVKKELVNDSLGTVDTADTTDTDPKDDQETGSGGVEGADKGRED